MPFYKRQDEQLLCALNGVEGPGYTLTEENRTENIYPVNGWYWYNSLDEALNKLPRTQPIQQITKRQAVLALNQTGQLDALNSALNIGDPVIKLAWDATAKIDRNDKMLLEMQKVLKWTDQQINQLFDLATTF